MTPTSQKLYYSSLCTKRKGRKVLQWWCCTRLEESQPFKCTNQCARNGGGAAKGDAGLLQREGCPGKPESGKTVTN